MPTQTTPEPEEVKESEEMAALKQEFYEREAREREWTEELAFIAKTKGFAAAFDHAQLAD